MLRHAAIRLALRWGYTVGSAKILPGWKPLPVRLGPPPQRRGAANKFLALSSRYNLATASAGRYRGDGGDVGVSRRRKRGHVWAVDLRLARRGPSFASPPSPPPSRL